MVSINNYNDSSWSINNYNDSSCRYESDSKHVRANTRSNLTRKCWMILPYAPKIPSKLDRVSHKSILLWKVFWIYNHIKWRYVFSIPCFTRKLWLWFTLHIFQGQWWLTWRSIWHNFSNEYISLLILFFLESLCPIHCYSNSRELRVTRNHWSSPLAILLSKHIVGSNSSFLEEFHFNFFQK